MKADRNRALLVEADELGHEARAANDDHAQLKLWLRMLSCTTQIEDEIKRRLRERFGISLARFDYMAQLHRMPDGMRMKELSRCLMVTGGNVTGVTDQLVADGYVERVPDPQDRRSLIVRLTPQGREQFLAMATEHEGWLVEMFRGFESAHRDTLYELLGRLRLHLAGQEVPAADTASTRAAARKERR